MHAYAHALRPAAVDASLDLHSALFIPFPSPIHSLVSLKSPLCSILQHLFHLQWTHYCLTCETAHNSFQLLSSKDFVCLHLTWPISSFWQLSWNVICSTFTFMTPSLLVLFISFKQHMLIVAILCHNQVTYLPFQMKKIISA